MQQAARVSNRTAYMHMGELIETGLTKNIFLILNMLKHKITLRVELVKNDVI